MTKKLLDNPAVEAASNELHAAINTLHDFISQRDSTVGNANRANDYVHDVQRWARHLENHLDSAAAYSAIWEKDHTKTVRVGGRTDDA